MSPLRADPSSPVAVLIELDGTQHQHGDALSRAGFRVVSIPTPDASVSHVLDHAPSVVAAELSPMHPEGTWEFIRQFRQHPQARLIPCIVYRHGLEPHDIETAARVGALWLQLEPSDGARLLAAARGLISAARKETIAKGD